MSHTLHPNPAVLVVPRIRISDLNIISSPLTWGFPAITAFTGLMTAIERQLGPDAGIQLLKVGVVCHSFEAQASKTDGYTYRLHLSSNPLKPDGNKTVGKLPPTIEEGRGHAVISLVFETLLRDDQCTPQARQALADEVAELIYCLRVAGGEAMPPSVSDAPGSSVRPTLSLLADAGLPQERHKQFKALARQLLPGYALISRDDLLLQRQAELRASNPTASALDAWLDLCSLTYRATNMDSPSKGRPARADWTPDAKPGWIVPIPVGYAPISPLQPAGSVRATRDRVTSVRFVENLWSVGQWVSPHRLQSLSEFMWRPTTPDDPNFPDLYRCVIDTPESVY